MKYVVLGFLHAYRFVISPLYGDVCKFYPTCSAYMLEAVQVHGAAKGVWLGLRRLGRCHPWSLGGYDPVPGTEAAHEWEAEQAAKKSAASSGGGATDLMTKEVPDDAGSSINNLEHPRCPGTTHTRGHRRRKCQVMTKGVR